ncbi:MAG: acyl-CoA desaturase, partial [Actinomycetes bacterium]
MTAPTTTVPETDVPETDLPAGTLGGERKRPLEQVTLVAAIAVPFVAILLAIPVAWGGWLGWSDVVLTFVMYAVSGHGITVGFHRYLTHGSFKAKRPLRVGLAIAGSLAIEGPAIRWVADHRKH